MSGREYYRFAPITWKGDVAVQISGTTIRATVVDESLDGIGLQLHQRVELSKGQYVVVSTQEMSRRGKLVFIGNGNDEKGQRIGLQWDPSTGFVENGNKP